jgi:hypothetical protein
MLISRQDAADLREGEFSQGTTTTDSFYGQSERKFFGRWKTRLTGRVHAPMNARTAGDTFVSGDLVVERRTDCKACAENWREVPSARPA